MNKKIFIIPLAVCTMGLASCNGASNRGLSRHSFKESTLENVQKIITGLEEKQWTEKKSQSGNVTMQEKKVSINAYSETKMLRTYDNVTFKEEITNKYDANWDQDNKTAILNINQSGVNWPMQGQSFVYNGKEGIKLTDDGNLHAFSESAGAKTKEKGYKPSFSDFNTICFDYFANHFEYYYIDFIGQPFSSTIYDYLTMDLFGGYNENHSVRAVFFDSGMLMKFVEKNATATYGSNDDNSVMIALKGTLPYKDFCYCIRPSKYNSNEIEYEGNVEFDYFFGLENCFVTQFEGTTKYNKAKMIEKDGDKEFVNGMDGEVYGKIDVNYKSGPSLNINLDDYIERY